MPNCGEVQDEHDVAFRVCEVLLDLCNPVEIRQRARKIGGLRVATFTPDCMPNENREIRHGYPLVTEEQPRVIVREEGGMGCGGDGAVGHDDAHNRLGVDAC